MPEIKSEIFWIFKKSFMHIFFTIAHSKALLFLPLYHTYLKRDRPYKTSKKFLPLFAPPSSPFMRCFVSTPFSMKSDLAEPPPL